MNQSPTIENNPPDGGFSARLAQLIQVLGMSQNEFSRRIESTSAYVSNMTTGKTKPGMEFLQKIALQFSVSLDWLVLGKGTMFGSLELNQNLHHAIFIRLILAKYYIYGNEQAKQLVGELFANTELTAPRVDGNVIDIVEQLDKRDLLDDMRLESNIGQGIVEIYNQVLYEIDDQARNEKILQLAIKFFEADNPDSLAILILRQDYKIQI